MKKLALGSVVLVALGAGNPALAADSWTGFYLNGGVGYGSWSADTTTVNPATGACVLCAVQTQGGNGWVGKVGIGYDYQASNYMVVGALLDYEFTDLKGTIQDQGPFFVGDIKQQWTWAAGGRIGWLVTPATLTYLNGGYSSAHFSDAPMVNAFNGVPTGNSTPSFEVSGWFVGIGMETKFSPKWSLRGEYRYANYSTVTLPDVGAVPGQSSITFKPIVQTGTIQVVYKFY